MWKIRAGQARAALEVARKTLVQARAKAMATASSARSNRFKLATAIADVKNQVAGLREAVARLHEAQAAEKLARAEADRYSELARRKSVTQEQADIRQTDHEQAQARVRQALEEVHKTRAALELSEEPAPGKRPRPTSPPTSTSAIRASWPRSGAFALNLAELGVPVPSYYDTPDQFIAEAIKRAPNGNIDALIARDVTQLPGRRDGRGPDREGRPGLAQAELDLSYCEIRSDIDGFVSNRNVNPGDRVSQGQRLMAVRPLEVWIDCNFKETQLEPIRIGHPVNITVDAYPGKVFRGRVTGFSPGTGSATALLPAQNATGNFVKIVQRLPVRVDLVGGNPTDTPLFVGLSVEPHVRVYDPPEGPHAGQRLRGDFPRVATRPAPLGLRPAGKSP